MDPYQIILVLVVAPGASLLTFFSGFGLGTLLLPAFALIFPLDVAVAASALVHLANNVWKSALVGRFADWHVVIRFGIPAVLAALVGAGLLLWLEGEPLWTYDLAGGHVPGSGRHFVHNNMAADCAGPAEVNEKGFLKVRPRHLSNAPMVAP